MKMEMLLPDWEKKEMNVEKANTEIKEKLGISENEVVMESQN